MRPHRWASSTLALLLLAPLYACGGGSPEPAAPAAEKPAAAKDEGDAGPADEADETPADDEKPEAKAPEPEKKISPMEVLTQEKHLFKLNFRSSEMYERFEEECAKKSGDDPHKNAACMTKKQEAHPGDTIGFKQEKGKWWWFTLNKRGSTLQVVHRIPIEFTDETDRKVTLKITGRDEGAKPDRNLPSQIIVEVPDEMQVFVLDPKHGKMVYEPRVGLIGE